MGSPDTPRNIVLCMDGTGNAPKSSGNTNVLRLFGMLEKDDPDRQVAFYIQGVGTRGDPAAMTGIGRWFTRFRGLITGYGMRRDISDTYRFLVENHRPGDRIFVFGFSRGAFAALALVGALRLFGLVRQGSANMIPYVAKGITKPVRKSIETGSYKFRARFSRPALPPMPGVHQWAIGVHFVGLWDTVKALKYLKFITKLKERWLKKWYFPSWPFTSRPQSIATLRHAVSIDDRRVPYDVFAINPHRNVDFNEVWFAGVHSDVGGAFEEQPGLGRITLKWMIEAAVDKGLLLRDGQYDTWCDVSDFDGGPGEGAFGKVHRNSVGWRVVGWNRRLVRRPFRHRFFRAPWKWWRKPPRETLKVHQSVYEQNCYTLPDNATLEPVDPDWKRMRPGGVAHAAP